MMYHASQDPVSGLEDLFVALFDAWQLRRFVERRYVEVAPQLLDGPVSIERLAHDTAQVFARNGLIEPSLFASLLAERPQMGMRIARWANLCRFAAVCEPVHWTRAPRITRAEIPEHVVDALYHDLRTQRELLRGFAHGPSAEWERLRREDYWVDSPRKAQAQAAIEEWIAVHIAHFTDPKLQKSLRFVLQWLRRDPAVYCLAEHTRAMKSVLTNRTFEDHWATLLRWCIQDDAKLYRLAIRYTVTR